jgi:hypothetical protein
MSHEPIGRDEAAEILRRLGVAKSVKSVPRVREVSRRRADHAKAIVLVQQAIAAQAQRCDDLENAILDPQPEEVSK